MKNNFSHTNLCLRPKIRRMWKGVVTIMETFFVLAGGLLVIIAVVVIVSSVSSVVSAVAAEEDIED